MIMNKNSMMKLEDKKSFTKRLNIIAGQINGLTKMIDSDRNYEDILIQLSALTNSLKSVGRDILANYMNNNISTNDKTEIAEAIKLFNKLV